MPVTRAILTRLADACQVLLQGPEAAGITHYFVALGHDVFEDDCMFLGLFETYALAQDCARRAAQSMDGPGPSMHVEIFPARIHRHAGSYHPSTYVD